MRTRSLVVSLLALALVAGCADQGSGDRTESSDPAVAEGALENRAQLDDSALQGKLAGILREASFTSESDYGYVVLEGDRVEGARLTKKLVREKLRAAVKEKSDDRRDILPERVRASRLDVSKAISDGNNVEIPDRDDDNYTYARHDRQLSIALKVMRSQLKGVVGFTFGTNESGDGDGEGNVLYIYSGISKTTGKVIAIMTEAVYT